MAATSPKKRKASELEEDPKVHENTAKSKHKSEDRTKAKKSKAVESKYADEIPFEIHCPPRPRDVEVEKAHKGNAKLAEGWECEYTILTKSGKKWQDIRCFRNVKLSDSTFAQGDTIYVLNRLNPPNPPGPGASEKENLEWDRKNTYVARFLEARAETPDRVFILIAYLYWPEEIPAQQKKQRNFFKDHAAGELIMSNDLQIIDATTISSKAEIFHWDETNDDLVSEAPERFWRQRFDKSTFDKKHDSPTALTPLRKFCRCDRPYNPDHTMYQHSSGCKGWNHEECLIDEVGARLWPSYASSNMDDYARYNTPPASKSLAQVVKNMGKKLEGRFENIIEQGVMAVQDESTATLHASSSTNGHNSTPATPAKTPPSKHHKKARPKKKNLWVDKLTIAIIANRRDQPLFAEVKEKSSEKSWQVKVDCLCCDKTMD